MRQVLSISDMKEKKIGLGEDSEPIFLKKDSFVAIGVLDGMGGAGGAECNSDYGESHTKAYVASRIIRDTIEKVLLQLSTLPNSSDLIQLLEKTITHRYEEERLKYPPKSKGGLRSTLIKEYPTTLAMVLVSINDDRYLIDSIWAGDSRNYIWNMNGIFQISLDDLKGNLDPLQNLREDAPMSNCLQADAPIRLNHKRISIPLGERFLIMSATDGCFGYCPSPMDFEKLLLESLRNSDSNDDWKGRLSRAFESVTADDFSYSMAAFNFARFKDLNKFARKLLKGNLQKYFLKRNEYENAVRKKQQLETKISEYEDELLSQINEIWPTYKQSYLKFMSTDEER